MRKLRSAQVTAQNVTSLPTAAVLMVSLRQLVLATGDATLSILTFQIKPRSLRSAELVLKVRGHLKVGHCDIVKKVMVT